MSFCCNYFANSKQNPFQHFYGQLIKKKTIYLHLQLRWKFSDIKLGGQSLSRRLKNSGLRRRLRYSVIQWCVDEWVRKRSKICWRNIGMVPYKTFWTHDSFLCNINSSVLLTNHTFDINCHCDFNIDFLANSYFIVQIYHAKSFKMKYIRSLYLNFY